MIVAPERLVFIVSFSDPAAGVTRHPRSATWPLQTLSTVTFEDQGGKTKLTLRQEVFETAEMCDLHREGWTASLERMVAEIAAARAA